MMSLLVTKQQILYRNNEICSKNTSHAVCLTCFKISLVTWNSSLTWHSVLVGICVWETWQPYLCAILQNQLLFSDYIFILKKKFWKHAISHLWVPYPWIQPTISQTNLYLPWICAYVFFLAFMHKYYSIMTVKHLYFIII